MAFNFTSLLAATELERHLRAKMENYIAKGRMQESKRDAAESIIVKMVAEVEEKPESWFEGMIFSPENIELRYHGRI